MYLVLNNKSKFYQLIYFKDGKRTSVSTGTSDKSEAEKFLKAFKPVPTKPATAGIKSQISLIKFSEEYKIYVGNTYSKNYLSQAVVPSCNKLLKLVPNLPLDCISTKTIDQFISTVQAKSSFAASLYYRTLKAAFTKAVVWNYIQENPFNKIKTPKTTQSYPAFVTLDELLKNILTGIQPKIINITNDDFVFKNKIGIKLNEGFVSKVFKRAVKLSKLNNKIHFHSLRHSFCSNLVQKGVSLYVVKDLAGHQNIKTTQIYSHLQKQNLMDAVNLL